MSAIPEHLRVQMRMRREHLVCKVFAAMLLLEHKGGSVDLTSDAVKNRIEKISKSSSIKHQLVLDAFYQASVMASAISFRSVAVEMTHERRALKLDPETRGSFFKTDLSVFRELCIELLLECEPGKFNLAGQDFDARVARIVEELLEIRVNPAEVVRALHDVYRLTFDRHLEELEKALQAGGETADESLDAAILRRKDLPGMEGVSEPEKPALKLASSQ